MFLSGRIKYSTDADRWSSMGLHLQKIMTSTLSGCHYKRYMS